jgi:hypothetical protein
MFQSLHSSSGLSLEVEDNKMYHLRRFLRIKQQLNGLSGCGHFFVTAILFVKMKNQLHG